VLEHDQDLEVIFNANSDMSPSSVYYFAIQHKEVEVFSEQIKFEPGQSTKEITIPADSFKHESGGVLTANLFIMDRYFDKPMPVDPYSMPEPMPMPRPVGEPEPFVMEDVIEKDCGDLEDKELRKECEEEIRAAYEEDVADGKKVEVFPVEPNGGIGDGAGPIPFEEGPMPVEPNGGIGDGAEPIDLDKPIPVEPDGGIGDGAGPIPFEKGPMPVEPNGGIGVGGRPLIFNQEVDLEQVIRGPIK